MAAVGRVTEVLGVMAVMTEFGIYGGTGGAEMSLILDGSSVSAQQWVESGREKLAVSVADADHLGVVRLTGRQDEVVDLLRRMLEAAESAVSGG